MRVFALALLCALSLPAADIAAGWTHSVAIVDGRVWAWGDNSHGQLGQPEAGRSLRPRPVPGLRNVVAVAAAWHTLALTGDGEVYAWGRNTYGQVGNGSFGIDAREPRPVRVEGLADVVAIAAGWDHSLALTRSGKVYAWGSRCHGQLGDGIRETGRPSPVPVPVRDLTDVQAIAAGAFHSLALTRTGTVLAWGGNWDGQLGTGKDGAGTHSALPQPVLAVAGDGPLAGIRGIAAAGFHSVAANEAGQLLAWGYNGTGQIPIGGRGSFWDTKGKGKVARPMLASMGGKDDATASVVAVAAGIESTYAVTAEGRVLSAGWAMYGELASGSHGGGNRDSLSPAVTGMQISWKPTRPGAWRPSLAYRYTDRGHIQHGVENLAVADAFAGPDLVAGDVPEGGARMARISRGADYVEAQAALTYPSQARVGEPALCLLGALQFGAHEGDDDSATDVRLRWTHLASGETVEVPLGEGVHAAGSAMPPLVGIVAVASGAHHAIARDRDGGLWAWGHNGYGQIGNGNTTDCAVALKLEPFAEGARPLPLRPAPAAPAPTAPPEGKVTNVREHGAKGDGIALDQGVLQRLIDQCSAAGGGILWFPPGTYRTGTLFLRSGVRLDLAAGATILASTNREHYPGRGLIDAADVHDVAVTGAGVVDAQGHFVGARGWRHYCIHTENCRNVRLEGVATINSGSWTQHHIRCIGLTIRNVTVRSLRPGRNNDGIDLSGCEDVLIEGCTVISDDDAIVIKSQRGERENRDIRVIGNVCHTYRGAFKLGTETRGVYENLLCRDLTCYGAKALELYSVDGSETQGIVIENVRGHDALVALNIRLGARLRPSYWAKGLEPKVGRLRDIRIRDVDVEVARKSWREILLEHGIPDAEWATSRPEGPYDSCISGLPGHPVENVVIEDFRVRVPGGATSVRPVEDLPERPEAYPHAGNFGTLPAYGLFVRHARNVAIRNAVFTPAAPDARPAVAHTDAAGLVVE